MTNTALRNKVEAKLIKGGNNINDVEKMLNLHFDFAATKFNKVSKIASWIRTIY